MNHASHCLITALVTSLLTSPVAVGEIQYIECLAHYYGSKSRPQIEIEIQDEGAPEDQRRGEIWFTVTVFEDNGIEKRAGTNLAQGPCDASQTETGWEIAGTSRMHGQEIRFRAMVSRDRSILEVLEPKSIVLADGTKIPLAGRYDDLSEKTRVESARAAFKVVDGELNAIYRKLIATLAPPTVAEMRSDQRRWLKYRDFTFIDGDNANIVGPGTTHHFRQQGRRTLERIAYLRAILSEPPEAGRVTAFYSNGRGGTFTVTQLDQAICFSGSMLHPHLHSADVSCRTELTLGGVARPASENTWLAKRGDIFAEDVFGEDEWPAEPLRLLFDPSGRLRVEAAGEDSSPGRLATAVGGSYHRLTALKPSEEPMRSLLVQLPEVAFGDTTEGLDAAEKKALTLTGEGGTFKLGKETTDRLELRHRDGKVTLLRLAGADGSAVVAVEQTNGRNLTLHLWKKTRADEPFRLWKNALPKLPIGEFFATGSGDNASQVGEASAHIYKLDHGREINLSLNVPPDGAIPDYYFSLDWDGYGFDVGRYPVK